MFNRLRDGTLDIINFYEGVELARIIAETENNNDTE